MSIFVNVQHHFHTLPSVYIPSLCIQAGVLLSWAVSSNRYHQHIACHWSFLSMNMSSTPASLRFSSCPPFLVISSIPRYDWNKSNVYPLVSVHTLGLYSCRCFHHALLFFDLSNSFMKKIHMIDPECSHCEWKKSRTWSSLRDTCIGIFARVHNRLLVNCTWARKKKNISS